MDGHPIICVWAKECLDTVVVARLESGFCDDIFGGMDQAFQRDDGSFMDSHPF